MLLLSDQQAQGEHELVTAADPRLLLSDINDTDINQVNITQAF